MTTRTLLLGLTLVAAGIVAMGVPMDASAAVCHPRPPLDQAIAKADAAFVGVVETLTNDDRWAQVRVEDIWRGTVVTQLVEVRGGQRPGVWSSADRTYVAGERYLFVVETARGHFRDDYCMATQPWKAELIWFRPPGAVLASEVRVTAEPRDLDPGSILLPVLAVVTIGIAVFGLVIAIRPNR